MSCVIKLKGTGSISADREVINKNFECLLTQVEDINALIDLNAISTTSDNVINNSDVEGANLTAALNNINTILENISTGSSLFIVDVLGDLPTDASEGDMGFIKDLQTHTTVANAATVAYVDGLWNVIGRRDAITYITDINNFTVSPGFDTTGATVSQMKGMSLSSFIDAYAFPTISPTIASYESSSLSENLDLNLEVGTSISPILTANFSKGSITNGDGSVGPNLVGSPVLYTFTGPGMPSPVIIVTTALSVILDSSNTGFTSSILPFGTVNWSVSIAYSQGIGTYYDSKQNASTILDADRVAGTSNSNSGSVNGRYYAFYGSGSIPNNSTEVRASANKTFLNASNNGSFNITIPAGTPEVYFSVPTGKTIQVNYIESLNADVTSTFASSTFDVNDAGGSPVSYDTWSTVIGVSGYPTDATYSVVIS